MTKQKWDLGDYVEVKYRIKAFWMDFPNGAIDSSHMIADWDADPAHCEVLAKVYTDITDPMPRTTGWAYEEKVGMINRTSFIENCETSAIGRALANMGMQGGNERPSREEMQSVQDHEDALKKAKLNLDGFIKMAEEEGKEIEARIIKRARVVSKEGSDISKMKVACETLEELLNLEGVTKS